MQPKEFEEAVHRIALAMWPGSRARPSVFVAEREVDGIYETRDAVHIIECTLQTEKRKAYDDGRKLNDNVRRLAQQHPFKAIKGYFITYRSPTPDQRHEIERHRNPALVALSFADFKAMLVDAFTYLDARKSHPFGSAAHPSAPGPGAEDYIPLDIILESTGELFSPQDLLSLLEKGQRAVLVADYGAGKSMTLREVFRLSSESYSKHETQRFAIHLNLREHKGQDSAEEALLRHASRCGYPSGERLIAAWRAGYAHIILDGFDEISSFAWQGDYRRVASLRRRALAIVRQFMAETPPECGVLVAGRENYFDKRSEAKNALGSASALMWFTLNEFTDQQIAVYLQRHGWEEPVPEWIPARPLLLGLLASRGLLTGLMETGRDVSNAAAWDETLDRVFEREASQQAGTEGSSIRAVLEHVASLVRARPDQLGPVYPKDLIDGFESVLGYPPDEEAVQVLLRLPMLAVRDEDDGSRQFADLDIADMLRAGKVFDYVANPYAALDRLDPDRWTTPLLGYGRDLLRHRVAVWEINEGMLRAALTKAQEEGWYSLVCDMTLVLMDEDAEAPAQAARIEGQSISELEVPHLSSDYSNVAFRDCLVDRLNIESLTSTGPKFIDCVVGVLTGPMEMRDIPEDKLVQCDIDELAPRVATTSGIMSMESAVPVRVGLSILKKLYLQRGRGRVEGALFRGLDQRAQGYVEDVLAVLQAHGYAMPAKVGGRMVWLPTRERRASARQILGQPRVDAHRVLRELDGLS